MAADSRPAQAKTRDAQLRRAVTYANSVVSMAEGEPLRLGAWLLRIGVPAEQVEACRSDPLPLALFLGLLADALPEPREQALRQGRAVLAAAALVKLGEKRAAHKDSVPNKAVIVGQLAEQGRPVAELARAIDGSLDQACTHLLRWLRHNGRVDVSPWVPQSAQRHWQTGQDHAHTAYIASLRAAGRLEEAQQLRIFQVAQWNAAHPQLPPGPVPLDRDGQPDRDAMLAAHWTLPQLVRATGLAPGTILSHVATWLRETGETDTLPWVAPARRQAIEGWLRDPDPRAAVAAALARHAVDHGELAVVAAALGVDDPRGTAPAHSWTPELDETLVRLHVAGTPVAQAAEQMGRTVASLRARAVRLRVIGERRAWK